MNFNLPISPWDFFLVLGRTSAMIAFFPMLTEVRTPRIIRAGMALWISLAITPLLPISGFHPTTLPDLAVSVGLEALFGILFGMALRMIFSGIMLGTEWIDLEIGFGASKQISPLTGTADSPFSNIVLAISALIFWSSGLFEDLLLIWARIFQLVPPPIHMIPVRLGGDLTALSTQMFVAGMQIATPVILVMFLVSLTIGLMARAIQGVNLFVESYNIKMLVGIVMLVVLAPFLFQLIYRHLQESIHSWTTLTRAWM